MRDKIPNDLRPILVVAIGALIAVSTCAGASSGTGFMVAPGLIVTNDHVIAMCGRIEILTKEGTVPATLVDAEPEIDLALLRVNGVPNNLAEIRRGPPLELGEQVMVFGFPLTGALSSAGNFTIGNVSSLHGLRDAAGQIQITAPIQPGNSGGPIIDTKGQVVGVVRSKLDVLRAAETIGDIPQNVNFGVSLSILLDFLNKNKVTLHSRNRGSDKSAVEIARIAQTYTYLVQCRGEVAAPKDPAQTKINPAVPSDTDRGSHTRAISRDASYLYAPPPVYPKAALDNRLEGRVVVRVEVLSNGLVGDAKIHVSSGFASLDRQALITVKAWRFNPALQNGTPVMQWVNIPVTFRLKR